MINETLRQIKNSERLTRECHKARSYTNKAGATSDFLATHNFTLYSGLFDAAVIKDCPQHIHKLCTYLKEVFLAGCPARENTASHSTYTGQLELKYAISDLTMHAKAAGYRNWGKSQHDIVQTHLHNWDEFTIATEIPVYDDDVNGFMDLLRIHPKLGWKIEIPDFKPDLPGTAKSFPATAMKTKKMQNIAAQLDKYARLLALRTGIDPEYIFCTAFDDEAAFLLSNRE